MYPHLNRAPIAEALLDFRVTLDKDVSLTELEVFAKAVSGTYPDVRSILTQQIQFQLADPQATAGSSSEIGKICWTADSSKAVQATLQGFTVNWTHGYSNFEALVEMARPLWDKYCSSVRPIEVVRCGLRYINRIDFGDEDIANILITSPRLGKNISEVLDEIFMRIGVQFEQERRGILTEAISAQDPGVLIFDIDVFVEKVFSPLDESIWDELNALRLLKNRCFFNSFSEYALESFK